MRSFLIVVGCCLALPLAAIANSPVDTLLKYVPEDAGMVVVFPNPEKLVTDVAAFGKAINVEELAELDMETVLEESPFGDIGAVLNMKAAAAFVMTPTMDEPLALLPVTSEAAWKEAVQPEATESGLYSFELGFDDAYGTVKDNILIAASDEDAVKEALNGGGKFAQRFVPQAGKLVADNDFVLYVHVPTWEPMIQGTIGMIEPMITSGMMFGAAGSPEGAQAATGMMKWLFNGFRTMLSEAVHYTVAFDIGADGIHLDDRASFKHDGKIAGYLKQVRKSKSPLLRSLPDAGYAIIFAYEWLTPPGTASLLNPLMQAMLTPPPPTEETGEAAEGEAAAEPEPDPAVKALVDQAIEMNNKLSGQNGAVMLAPGGKGMLVTGMYLTKEPAPVLKGALEMVEGGFAMMSHFGMPMTAETAKKSEIISSVKTEVVNFKFDSEDEEMGATLAGIYGDNAASFLAARDDGVLYVVGPEEHGRAQMEKALTGKPGKLVDNAHVKTAFAKLSPDPQFLALFDAPKLIEFGLGLAGSMGAPVPEMELPKKQVPYAALAMYLEPDTARIEVLVPSDTIKVIIEAIESAEADAGMEPEEGEM